MALIERKTYDLWGQPLANSAQLLSAEGKPRGLLIEDDTGLRFRAAGEKEPRFDVAWPSIETVGQPFGSPRRMDVMTGDAHHQLKLTDTVIDGSLLEDGPDGGDPDAFPVSGGALPPGATREERLLDDVGTAVEAGTAVIGYIAADRVRRRRIAERILTRADRA